MYRPLHRQSLCPSRPVQTPGTGCASRKCLQNRLGSQQFQPRGKSGIPPPPWRRQRDMRHAQLSFHCSTAHSGIQEDFSFSVCRPLHIIPLRGTPFFWDGGFSGSVKDSGMQKKNQPSQTGSFLVKNHHFPPNFSTKCASVQPDYSNLHHCCQRAAGGGGPYTSL